MTVHLATEWGDSYEEPSEEELIAVLNRVYQANQHGITAIPEASRLRDWMREHEHARLVFYDFRATQICYSVQIQCHGRATLLVEHCDRSGRTFETKEYLMESVDRRKALSLWMLLSDAKLEKLREQPWVPVEVVM